MTLFHVIEWLIKGFVWALVLLGGFAYLTLYERRALARMQSRIGPNRAGPFGLLQPIADAVKLIFKEELTPANADKLIFLLAPVITVVPAVIITAVVPWGPSLDILGYHLNLYIADINVGVLYIMSIASIAVYGIVLAGWSSNNKYAMMGGLRSSAQMISYELALGLSFVSAILLAGSMRMIAAHGSKVRYYHDVLGLNSRLDTLQAAILLVKLPHLGEYNAARRRAAARYDELLRGLPVTVPAGPTGEGHIFHQYTLRAPKRDALAAFLKEKGIPHGVYYPVPLHLQKAFAMSGGKKGDFPIAERAAEEVISLPMHTELTEEHLQYITGAVREFYAANSSTH